MNRLRTAAALLAVMTAAASSSASAQLFSTGPATNQTNRLAFDGPGEELSIANTLTLTSLGFWAGLPGGGTVDFMIFNTSGSLLFSTQKSFGATADGTLITSNPFAFTLNAGSTYSFDIVADNSISVQYFFPGISQCTNGICVVNPNANDNVDTGAGFSSPILSTNSGSTTIAIELNGTLGATTPEPATYAMMATGLVGLAGAGVRKRRAR